MELTISSLSHKVSDILINIIASFEGSDILFQKYQQAGPDSILNPVVEKRNFVNKSKHPSSAKNDKNKIKRNVNFQNRLLHSFSKPHKIDR